MDNRSKTEKSIGDKSQNSDSRIEEWRLIPGYEYYEVSCFGRVRNFKNKNILKPGSNGKGYLKVCLGTGVGTGNGRKNSKVKKVCYKYVHQLVLLAFVGPAIKGHNINHINCIKSDNRLENLEYVTFSQNSKNIYLSGTLKRGLEHPLTKLDRNKLDSIRLRLKNGESHSSIARALGVSRPLITNISLGKRYKDV